MRTKLPRHYRLNGNVFLHSAGEWTFSQSVLRWCVQETLNAVVRKQIYMKINNHNIFHLTFVDCRTLNGRVTNQKRRISFRLPIVHASSGSELQANSKIMRKLDLAFFFSRSPEIYVWSGVCIKWWIATFAFIYVFSELPSLNFPTEKSKPLPPRRRCFE